MRCSHDMTPAEVHMGLCHVDCDGNLSPAPWM